MSKQTDEINEILLNFGLEESEAKIFEYLLKTGPCSISKISNELKIPRDRKSVV